MVGVEKGLPPECFSRFLAAMSLFQYGFCILRWHKLAIKLEFVYTQSEFAQTQALFLQTQSEFTEFPNGNGISFCLPDENVVAMELLWENVCLSGGDFASRCLIKLVISFVWYGKSRIFAATKEISRSGAVGSSLGS